MKQKINNFYFSNADECQSEELIQHYHPHFEIYYIKEGEYRYFIDDCVFDVKAGDVIFIPKGIIHRTSYTTPSHTLLRISFSEDYIPEDALPHISNLGYIFRSKEISKNIEELFSKIEVEYNKSDDFSQSLVGCYTAEIFYLIIRHPGDLENSTTGNKLIDSIVKYLKENYMNDIKLSAVAKMNSVSQEHLSRTFKSCTGFGFNEYLTLLRLRMAEEMIKNEPDKTISEIAYECGFNDGNYFSYKFKKMYGVSPIKLRSNK